MATVRITYYGNTSPPLVEHPEGITVEFVSAFARDTLFMEHGGVRIYRTIRGESRFNRWEFSASRFAVCPGMHEHSPDGVVFDIADLPAAAHNGSERELIANAIDRGWIKRDRVDIPPEDGRLWFLALSPLLLPAGLLFVVLFILATIVMALYRVCSLSLLSLLRRRNEFKIWKASNYSTRFHWVWGDRTIWIP